MTRSARRPFLRAGGLLTVSVFLAAVAVACNDDDTIRFEGGAGSGETPSTFVIEPEDGAPSGASGGGTVGGSGSASGGAGGGTTGGGSDSGAGGSGSGGSSGSGGESPPDSGGGGSGSGGGGAGGGGAGEPEPEPIEIDDRGRVGDMGRLLLGSEISQANIEIDATPGEALTSQARSGLQNQLAEHGGKSVSFVAGDTLPEQDVYTTDALRSIMESQRSNWSTSGRLGIYVMVLSGRHEDEDVVGVSFNSTAFAVFSERLGGGLLGLNYASYEEAVTVHELGHLFGLVNLTGLGAFHEDATHRKHSANEGSVMYWAVESTVVGDVFTGGPPRDFDGDDEQEMAAIRQS